MIRASPARRAQSLEARLLRRAGALAKIAARTRLEALTQNGQPWRSARWLWPLFGRN